MPNPKLFIDTNILIYSTYEDSSYFNSSIHKIIEVSEKYDLYISCQVLREFVKNVTSYNYLKIEDAYEQVRIFSKQFKILFEDQQTLTHWMKLIDQYQVKGKSVYDCNIVATMLSYDIPNILTNDEDFKRYGDQISVIML